ncbi:MAG: alkane 1-monooxygenase [Paracoccaceae bacterium]
MVWFVFASLLPAALLGVASVLGGVWPLLAVISITVFVLGIDVLSNKLGASADTAGGDRLIYVLAGVHFILWPIAIWALADAQHLNGQEKFLIWIGIGLWVGQISNSNAHELIHRSSRLAHGLGTAIYTSTLFGHHTSTHLRIHHVHAATSKDPNSARVGESFYWFFARAWVQGFSEGKRAENMLRARKRIPPPAWTHPYLRYVLGGLGFCVLAFALAGPTGVVALICVSLFSQVQLYLSDYVQHYGLLRHMDRDGVPEPIGDAHSWNAPQWYSSAMMLNAPRHSDHHANPTRTFPELRYDARKMPTLPYSLPVMAVIALIPPLWRACMDDRVRDWAQSTDDLQAA